MNRRLLLLAALLVVMLAVAGCGDDGSTDTTSSAQDTTGLVGIVRDEPLFVGDVVLPDVTDGAPEAPFPFKARPGELLVGYFGYTSCPDVCPTTLANLASASSQLGAAADRLDLAMVTVDPDRDTAERLTRYLRSFAARVHAIRTTDTTQLHAAEDAFGAQSAIVVDPNGTVDVQHSATTYVIDDTGRVLVEWPFGVSADDMRHDLEILLAGTGSAT